MKITRVGESSSVNWENVTDLGSVSIASFIITDHYIFVIFFAVAIGMYRSMGSCYVRKTGKSLGSRVRTFRLFAIGISSPRRQLLDIILGLLEKEM